MYSSDHILFLLYRRHINMPVKVSHTIELGPELSNDVMDIARKQGENPERVCADIQELRDMIFGKFYLISFQIINKMFSPQF